MGLGRAIGSGNYRFSRGRLQLKALESRLLSSFWNLVLLVKVRRTMIDAHSVIIIIMMMSCKPKIVVFFS